MYFVREAVEIVDFGSRKRVMSNTFVKSQSSVCAPEDIIS